MAWPPMRGERPENRVFAFKRLAQPKISAINTEMLPKGFTVGHRVQPGRMFDLSSDVIPTCPGIRD